MRRKAEGQASEREIELHRGRESERADDQKDCCIIVQSHLSDLDERVCVCVCALGMNVCI